MGCFVEVRWLSMFFVFRLFKRTVLRGAFLEGTSALCSACLQRVRYACMRRLCGSYGKVAVNSVLGCFLVGSTTFRFERPLAVLFSLSTIG